MEIILDYLYKLPLAALVIGIILNHLYKLLEKRKNRKIIKKYLKFSIDYLTEVLQVEVEIIDGCIVEIEKMPERLPSFSHTYGFHTKNFDNISKPDVFEIIVLKNNSIKDSNTKLELLTSFNDAIETVSFYSKIDIYGHHKYENDLILEYKEHYFNIMNLWNKLTVEVNNGDKSDKKIQDKYDFAMQFKHNIENEGAKQLTNHIQHYYEFIQPLKKLIMEYEIIEFMDSVARGETLLLNIINNRVRYLENLTKTRKQLMFALKNLHDVLPIFIKN